MASNNPTFELGFVDDFKNVFEMVAETSEASKDQQVHICYQWKQHVHVHMCYQWKQPMVHVQNLQFNHCRKSDFSAWKLSFYVIKAMDNV